MSDVVESWQRCKKKGAELGALFFLQNLIALLASASHLTLVPSCRVLVDQSLPGSAIELLHCLPTIFVGAGSGAL